ncbi:ABC transporter permease [Haloferacaceae archaeon DSL9]
MSADTTRETLTFEDVDWDEIQNTSRSVSTQRLAFLAVSLLFGVGIASDLLFGRVPLVGEAEALDWLFWYTLVLGVFFVVLPLYNNKRMTKHYWKQFRKNKAAVISLVYLGITLLIGTVGPWFLEEPSLDVRGQRQPPVFLSVSENAPIACKGEVADGRCYGTWEHPLGTSAQGHDLVDLLIFGMEVSMQVGLIGSAIIILLGALVGATAALFGGRVDELLMRYVDLQLTIPTFFLFILIVYLFGGSLFLMIMIFGFLSWGGIARLVRSEALQRTEEEYIKAAESAGGGRFWILRRHVIPNVSNTIITAATLTIPFLILAEAGLSFLGLGDPMTYSWGQTIAKGRGELGGAWWISTIPGIFLFFTVLAFNFLGDALRDALDPRSET